MLGSNQEISRSNLNLRGNNEDMGSKLLSKEELKKNQLNTEVEKPKLDESKPLSVALMEGKIQQKDLFAQINAKAAKLGFSQFSDQALESTSSQADGLMESLFDTPKDLSQLSTIASQTQAQTTGKQEKVSRSTRDWNEILSDDNPDGKTEKSAAESKAFQQAKGNMPQPANSQAAKEVLSKYISAFSQNLIAPTPEKRKELNTLKEKLLDDGFPRDKLDKAEKKMEKIIYNDLKQKAKETYINLCLVYNKNKLSSEAVQQNQQFNTIKEFGKKLGFLVDDVGFDDLKAESHSEIHSLISNEMDKSLVSSVLKGKISEIAKEFEKFNAPATNTGFSTNDYIKEIGKKFENLGLKPLFLPEDQKKRGVIDTKKPQQKPPSEKLKTLFKNFAMSKSTANEAKSDNKKKKSPKGHDQNSQNNEEDLSEFSELQEGETPEEKVRNIYIQLMIKSDLKSQINLRLELAKVIYKFEIDKPQLKALKLEAEAIAKFKLMDLLRESFEERASLAELKGPSFDLVRKKLKTALSGLKNLGIKPEKKELESLRDQVNKTMFSIVREEYIKVELYLEADPPNKGPAKNRRNELLGMLNRLKEESRINEDIRPKEFRDITLKSETNIVDIA